MTGVFPPEVGGPATSVPKLAQMLVETGHDVRIVTLSDRPGQRTQEDPCDVARLHRVNPLVRAPLVARAVLRGRPDVVLANGLHMDSCLLATVPVVQKLTGDWAWERASNRDWTDLGISEFQSAALPVRPRVLRAFRSAVTRRARLVIAPSRFVGQLVVNWGVSPTRVRVVPNAAPPLTEPSSKRDLSILFVGRLIRLKRVDDLIRAVYEVPDATLDVLGDGPLRSDLEALSRRLGVDRRVAFHGRVSRAEVQDRMRRARVLVLPSSGEGMPHVVLEAFAASLPVVATAVGGTPELVENGHSGLLYDWGDLEGLVAAIRRALDPAEGDQLAAGGRAVAAAATMEASARATASALEDAATA